MLKHALHAAVAHVGHRDHVGAPRGRPGARSGGSSGRGGLLPLLGQVRRPDCRWSALRKPRRFRRRLVSVGRHEHLWYAGAQGGGRVNRSRTSAGPCPPPPNVPLRAHEQAKAVRACSSERTANFGREMRRGCDATGVWKPTATATTHERDNTRCMARSFRDGPAVCL